MFKSICSWIALGTMMLLLSGAAFGQQATTVFWTPPDTREDGTAFTAAEVEFYELCVSADDSGPCAGTPFVFETTSTAVPLESLDLDYGTWYFTVRVQDTSGLFSSWSPVVSHQILAPPNPPAGLGVN